MSNDKETFLREIEKRKKPFELLSDNYCFVFDYLSKHVFSHWSDVEVLSKYIFSYEDIVWLLDNFSGELIAEVMFDIKI